MDPITAGLQLAKSVIELQTEIFKALPDADKAAQSHDLLIFSFSIQQMIHDLNPKFPAPPVIK